MVIDHKVGMSRNCFYNSHNYNRCYIMHVFYLFFLFNE